MDSQQVIGDCKFCSVISKNNGEDPIGTATTVNIYLMVEIPLPWIEENLMANPAIQQIFGILAELHQQNIHIMPLAIAPDKEYSVSGHTRVMYFRRPEEYFAKFEKQEYIIPEEQLAPLIITLLKQQDQIHQFASYQQPDHQNRDLMVCTHGNIDVACSRFGTPIYEKLRKEYAAKSNGQIRVWRCSHFGGHQFAPTCLDLPTGQIWGHIEPHILDNLVQRNSEVTELRQFYRGCAGLTKFEQIVEREIWMQEGWDWLNYQKSGQILIQDTSNEHPDWAEVQIDFKSPDLSVQGTYTARVEVSGTVMTALNSGNEQPLNSVKQYRVTQLKKK